MSFYRHRADYCFQERLGPAGLERTVLDGALARLAPTLASLKAESDPLATALLAVPQRQDDLAGIEALAGEIRSRYRHVVVAGSGGSGLSGRVFAEFCHSPHLHFIDNIDPDCMSALLANIDIAQSGFIVVSKSGSTVETLGQFYVLLEAAKRADEKNFAERFTIITAPADSPLRRSGQQYGMRLLDHEAAIGGRFSIFTNVGLLPGAIAGVDIARLRQGAASVVNAMSEAKSSADFPPALGAALQFAFMERGRNVSVMLPYGSRLAGFSSWYRQCWAESLGKGGKGTTPIRAVGTTDQHSQLQLYLDGPPDKLFHLITVRRAGTGQAIAVPDFAELAYLRGKTTGDVMAAEQKATLETLLHNHCPVRRFELDRLEEEQLGALLMHFTLEIIFMAALLGVNPFDQPAVEEGKTLAREYLQTGSL
jgi:glucose-6-phosphate isomerase